MERAIRRFENPYRPLKPARGINFAGREDVIHAFRQRIGAESAMGEVEDRHLLLVGVGGIGKTSLLLRLQHEFQQAYPRLRKRAVYLNLRNYSADAAGLIADLRDALPRPRARRSKIMTFFGLSPTASLEDLGEKLREDFVQSVSFTFPAPGWEFAPGIFSRRRSPREGMAKQLARVLVELSLLTMEDDKPTLILIDEAGTANEIPGAHQLLHSLSRLMDASVQAKNRNLLLVLAARPERKGQLEHDFRVELFDPSYIRRLPVYALTRDEGQQAIIKPAQEAGIHLSEQFVSDLYDSAGGHPYFLQIACSQLWEYLVAEERLGEHSVQVDAHTIAAIVRQGQAKLFQDFNSDEQYLLKVLALSPRPMNAMEIKKMVELEDKDDLIDVDSTLESLLKHKHRPITARRQQDDYTFTHALFRDHVREHELTADERDVAALQAILDGLVQVMNFGRWKLAQSPLDADLLQRTWHFRDRLRVSNRHLEVLIFSELHDRRPDRLTWAVSSEALDHLIPILHSGARHLSRSAGAALARIDDPRAVEALIGALESENREVRSSTAAALGRIGDARAVESLIQALLDKDERVRVPVIQALAEIGAPAIEPLIEALGYSDSQVRSNAAAALGRIGDAGAVGALIKALQDKVSEVRSSAAWALGRIGDGQAVGALIKALQDRESEVRSSAASALGQTGHSRGLEPLIEVLHDEDRFVRLSARNALAGIGGPALESLINGPEHTTWDVRSSTAAGVGRIDGVGAVKPLIDALSDESISVRETAALALGTIGDTQAVEELINLLGDDAKSVREATARALGEIGAVQAVGPLVVALGDEDGWVREAVIESLGKIGEPAVEALEGAVSRGENSVREAAAWSLGLIGDTRAVEALIAALADEDNSVRDAAAWALGQIGELAVTVLIKALGHEASSVREAAARALGFVADPRANEALTDAVDDPDRRVRDAAEQVLEEIALGRI